MHFVICDKETGAIKRVGNVPGADLGNQSKDDSEVTASSSQLIASALIVAASGEQPPPFAVDVTSPGFDIATPAEVADHIEAVTAFGQDIAAWQKANPRVKVDEAPVEQKKSDPIVIKTPTEAKRLIPEAVP